MMKRVQEQDVYKRQGYDIVDIGDTIIAPLSIYNNKKKISSIEEIKDGDVIAIPSDLTNGGRALKLLEEAGFIVCDPEKGYVPVSYTHLDVYKRQVLTLFIPLGQYETKEITYMQNGSEKTRTVLDPDSFRYVLDENGNKVTKAAPIFGTEDFGGQGILNFVFEGMTVGDKNGTAVGIIAVSYTHLQLLCPISSI